MVGEHAEGLVHEQVAGGLRAVVPGAVDARGRGDVLVDVVFGARRGRRALVGDEAGEQAAALAFDLRVDAPFRGAVPMTVSDSKWPNSCRESTRLYFVKSVFRV